MLYYEYIDKAEKLVVEFSDDKTAYLRPDYRYVLSMADFKISDITDFDEVNMDIVSEHIKADVSMFNKNIDKTNAVMQWAYDVINTVADPAMTETKNAMAATMIKAANEATDNVKPESDNAEQSVHANNVIPFEQGIFSLSKKKSK